MGKPNQTTVSISGDSSVKPDLSATEKMNKEQTLTEVKSKIKSKATPNTDAKTAVQKCPLLDSIPPVKPKKNGASKDEKINCDLAGMTILKSQGSYTLTVAAIKNSSTAGKLEVVAGYNKRVAKMKCKVLGPVGPCKKIHIKKVIDFTDKSTLKNDTTLEFNAASVYAFNFFPWNPAAHSYDISANTCGAGVGASLTVYPDTYWHLKITTTFEGKELDEFKIEGDYQEDQNSLTFSASSKSEIAVDFKNDTTHAAVDASDKGVKGGYKDQNTTVGLAVSDSHVESYFDDKKTQTTSHVSTDKNSLGSNGEIQGVQINDISLQSGDTKIQISERLRSNLNSLYQAIEIVKFIKGLIDVLSESGSSPVTFELNWPNIELEGHWQWKEIAGTPKCGFEYDLSGGLHPLIGCGINIDLVGAILLAIPGFGAIVTKILNAIEYWTGDELKVNLKLTGDLNTDVGISKMASAAEPTISMPNTHVDIILELSATLKLKQHYTIIGYGGGGKGSAKIIITLHKPIVQNQGINLPCDYQFTGITIYSVEYVKDSSSMKDFAPDDEDEINEVDKERGHWFEGESHAFSVALI